MEFWRWESPLFFGGDTAREITYDDLLDTVLKEGAKDTAAKFRDMNPHDASPEENTPTQPSTVAAPAPTTFESFCADFNDEWFGKMTYINGYCYPGTWGDLPVSTAEASFGAALNIGLIGEGESITKMDEQFQTDWSGRNMQFGTSRNQDNLEEEFKEAPLGSFATRSSWNFWMSVIDAKGVELGYRQDVSIGYIVRQGRCYATMGARGQGPLNSRAYYGILSDQMQKEAERVTETMKSIALCGN